MSPRASKPVARPEAKNMVRTADGASRARKRGEHGTMKVRPAGTLKSAILGLVEANGGCVRAGEVTETTKGNVQRWTDPDGETASTFPGVNKIRLLEASCGEPIVTRWMAAESGHVLVRMLASPQAAISVLAGLAGGEMGDVLRAVANAIEDDGELSPTEAGQIIKEIDEVLSALAAARAVAVAVRDGGAA